MKMTRPMTMNTIKEVNTSFCQYHVPTEIEGFRRFCTQPNIAYFAVTKLTSLPGTSRYGLDRSLNKVISAGQS